MTRNNWRSHDQRHRIAQWIELRTAQLAEEINAEKARRQAVGEMESAMIDRHRFNPKRN